MKTRRINMPELDLNSIVQYPFSTNQYMQEEYPKKQIFLHHTAGNHDPFGVFRWWEANQERVAVCAVIGGRPDANDNWRDGEIVQGYSSKFWAYHLGLRQAVFAQFGVPYQPLDKTSIAIEICNWGELRYINGKFYTYVNTIVPRDQVVQLNYRGSQYFHAYTDAQIESVRQLLVYWGNRYNIPLTYNPNMFEVNAKALAGMPGVWTHTSVRYDKNDLAPQPKLLAMLQSL